MYSTLLQPRYLLDTSIVIAIARQNDLFHRIEAQYKLTANARSGSSESLPYLSLVSVAEINSLALYNGWSEHRIAGLNRMLDEFIILPIDGPDLVDRYARIDVYSRRSGRPMGKNDLWIAVAANITGATLLTTDKDFDHLNGKFIDVEWVNPE